MEISLHLLGSLQLLPELINQRSRYIFSVTVTENTDWNLRSKN